MFEYLNESNTANIVGSFTQDKDEEFKGGIKALYESFNSAYSLDLWSDVSRILKNDSTREAYKQELMGDVLQESFNDEYFDLHKDKLEQLFENTAMEIITESQMGMMNPIVGFSLPILKKNYYENVAKDIIMTEVPDKPFIKIAFERGFLKDAEGKKYYIPDCFYDNTYKEAYKSAKGISIYDYYKQSSINGIDISTNGVVDKGIVAEVLGTTGNEHIAKRQSLAHDFGIQDIEVTVMYVPVNSKGVAKPSAASGDVKTLTLTRRSLGCTPDFASKGVIQHRLDEVVPMVPGTDESTYDGVPELHLFDSLYGGCDTYYGTLTILSPNPMPKADTVISEGKNLCKITKVFPGGHLSNELNERTIELDYERDTRDYKIEDGERLNTGLTLEKIKDTKALLNIDITSKVIADMTTVLTNMEDSNMMDFLNNSFEVWRDKTDLPFGYGKHIQNGKFIEEATFSCVPPAGTMVTQSSYIDSELKFNIDRLLDQLKVKLNNKDVMFVIYAHPNNITLIQNQVRWVVSEDTKIGGVQLDYRFGVMNCGKSRVHVVSSQKINQKMGFRVVAHPLTQETITFKHYKYSLNIENSYRNPLTPLTPNIMATQRYKTIELLPVQGGFELTNNGFGLKDRTMYAGNATTGDVLYPR